MGKNPYLGIAAMLTVVAIVACTPGTDPPSKAQLISQHQPAETAFPVRTVPCARQDFPLRSQTQGTLRAVRQAEVKATMAGELVALPINEGQYVEKGTLVAAFDTAPLQLQLEKARLVLEEATYDKNDLLVMQGGTWGVDSSVNEATLLSIQQQSGLKKAQHTIKELEYGMAQARVLAPFGGMVANLEAKAHQQLGAGTVICRLLDPQSFEAVFELLEKEALPLAAGQAVKIQPLASPGTELRGSVSHRNPEVDERGLVRIHARIRPEDLRSHRQQLLEGMNLRIVIEKAVPGQLVVPRSAVVLRSGRPVVFTFDSASGLAKWNYVTISHENDTHFAISGGLQEGDLVIVEGNLNLAHDAAVVLGKK